MPRGAIVGMSQMYLSSSFLRLLMHKSISTQTKSAHDIKWAVKKEHKHTNTNHVTTHDKSTNTNPLVVLDPDDIKTL